jgi:crotonobetainyl-CoA:carnitine CoA-transferase CaiB-like acyl-CoA transferase
VVAREVLRWQADELEEAVVAAGGCAAAMRTEAEWNAHPAGVATACERPVVLGAPVDVPAGWAAASGWLDHPSTPAGGDAPLAGIRVLDLTRVIAGPVATRYLAAYGAEVVRIDPPGFEEVGALLPEATAGKRCAALDLRTAEGRATFERLVAEADVVVGGLRPGALAGLGFGPVELRALNPGLITVTHDAYGWSGPWAHRRGFDSLVQMSTGIAAAGAAAAGSGRPTPLPAQALDHGVGHLLAAATCRALTRLAQTGCGADVRGSLVGAANVVRSVPAPNVSPSAASVAAASTEVVEVADAPTEVVEVADAPTEVVEVADAPTEVVDTEWGRLRHAPLAGRIEGLAPRWSIPAGPLGRHQPEFATPH